MTSLLENYNTQVADGCLTSDPAQVAVLSEFETLRATLHEPAKRGFFRKAPKPPKGVYLWGGVGRGKSFLMDFFVAHLDIPVRRVHFHAFMQEIHSAMHKARQSGVSDAIKPVAQEVAASVKVLAFDEMQITDITDAMIVGRLFEALFAAGVVVVTTSNRVPDDLYKDGLNRALFLPFINLLKDQMTVWELASPTDYRQERLRGRRTYFAPINAETRAEMNDIWTSLVPKGADSPLALTVKGRQFDIPAFYNGIARAGFFELCARAVGAADYLALAQNVRVLLLDDIPQMDRSKFNEAKRFVTLIDTLYEARVALICSAAARPDMLYLEGDGIFEFERTASRLEEMQSADWTDWTQRNP